MVGLDWIPGCLAYARVVDHLLAGLHPKLRVFKLRYRVVCVFFGIVQGGEEHPTFCLKLAA